ncbi:hypothetical protein COO91_03671 [Nostoc flagelliforme CCNUN1]|uniref:Uncharacterized protein n=1 Tax=Nostoc flagelliforme CCNUN1 TaxID=2038116 RepID=A0A2K8SQH7_9NOSO|nr:hypothetical protein COO91_03671 [Nostoc flagelliforme CCNUN1]
MNAQYPILLYERLRQRLRSVQVPHAQCPMPNAPCPIPYSSIIGLRRSSTSA